MKKILSLVVALMLLMLCPAMAETTAQTQTLVSPDGSYSVEVPADYFQMNADLMMNVIKTEEMKQLMAQMMGLEDASQLELYLAVIEESNMMIIFTDDWSGNLNVQATAVTLTMEQLIALKAAMDAALTQQYVSVGVAEEEIKPMEIQEIGAHKWYGMQLTMMAMPVQAMITIENGVQYVLTFTSIEEAEMQSILASFTVTAAAE